ncbi:hypothetical protein AURDEDRAFT_156428 [Auricularia subglabra TFB-10046 SS5]|nr:hypothetical protein AURDEDRAFT_156428 [Auricularia subglabra TFB-10046 SS5]
MSRTPLLTTLPPELIRIILELVVSDCERQAWAVSLLRVSKTVHAWVLPVLSHTIVLSALQVERFVRQVHRPAFVQFLSQIKRLCLLDIHQNTTLGTLALVLTWLSPGCRLAVPAVHISLLHDTVYPAPPCTHVFLITSAWTVRALSADNPRGPEAPTVHPSATPIRTERLVRFTHVTHLAIGPDAPTGWQDNLRDAVPTAFPALTHLAIVVRIRPFVLRDEIGGEDPLEALCRVLRSVLALAPRMQRLYVRLYKWDIHRGIEDPSVAYLADKLRPLLAGLRDRRVFMGSAPIPRRRLDSETCALWALGDTPWEDGQPVFPPA